MSNLIGSAALCAVGPLYAIPILNDASAEPRLRITAAIALTGGLLGAGYGLYLGGLKAVILVPTFSYIGFILPCIVGLNVSKPTK